MAINEHERVSCCKPAHCAHIGKCLDECLKRYRAELGIKGEARWKHRAEYNDFILAECSNCGFRVEAFKAVVSKSRDTNYVDVKYKFCPMWGKSMGV